MTSIASTTHVVKLSGYAAHLGAPLLSVREEHVMVLQWEGTEEEVVDVLGEWRYGKDLFPEVYVEVDKIISTLQSSARDRDSVQACEFLIEFLRSRIASEEELRRRMIAARPYKKIPIPPSLRKQVFERDAYRCVKCGSWINLHCDHIYPERLGGETVIENLQTLCRTCNTSKGARV